ncbi:MAG: hypothetical protein ACKO66_04320 [Flavobacteriales bacterium]
MDTRIILFLSVVINVILFFKSFTNQAVQVDNNEVIENSKAPMVETHDTIHQSTVDTRNNEKDTVTPVHQTVIEDKSYLIVHIYEYRDDNDVKYPCDLELHVPANPYSYTGHVKIIDRQTKSTVKFEVIGYNFNILWNTLLDAKGNRCYINLNNYDQFDFTLDNLAPPMFVYTLFEDCVTEWQCEKSTRYFADRIRIKRR